ncbi:hypothetical protein TELCIR_06396, partial [Teladorsagia circumcincta]
MFEAGLQRVEDFGPGNIQKWKSILASHSAIIPNLKPLSKGEGNERLKLKIVDFDAEILRMNYEALGCTHRMVAELEKMNEEGVMTLSALENQDEQLDKLEANLHQINDDISAVTSDITKMERCCCFPIL